MGSFRLVAGNRHLHRYYNFAGRVVETVPRSLHHSCGSELAAVYRGFNSMLSHLLLTFRHRAGVSPYTSSFDLAETCVFAKQLPGPIHCGSPGGEHSLSLSYGVNLPSSLTTLLPLALESSSYLPVSVCGTGTYFIYTELFSPSSKNTSLL